MNSNGPNAGIGDVFPPAIAEARIGNNRTENGTETADGIAIIPTKSQKWLR